MQPLLQEAPTPEQLATIEALSNAKVDEGAAIEVFVVDFAHARAQYDFAMCDSFVPKPGPVAIAYLPAWNFNVVEEGAEALFATTAGVGRIEVLALDAADGGSKCSKGKLDLRFRIHGGVTNAPRSAPSAAPPPDPSLIAVLNPKVEKKAKKAAAAPAAPAEAGGAAAASAPTTAAPRAAGSSATPAIAAAVSAVAAAAPAVAAAASTVSAAGEPSGSAVAADEGGGDASAAHLHGGEGQTITPWEVEAAGGIDYEKLIRVGRAGRVRGRGRSTHRGCPSSRCHVRTSGASASLTRRSLAWSA